MALPLPPDPRPPSEPLSHPPGAPREPDIAECIICSASEEEAFRPEQAQKLGQDSLDPLDHFQGGLRGAEPATSPPRLPTPSAHEDPAGGRHWEVSEEADWLDQDLEAEGDLDGPGPGGVWGPWAPGGVPIPAELEWDPAGDVGGLGPWGRRAVRTPGAPCELCGHRGPQGRGQDPELSGESQTSFSSQDVLRLGLSPRKHLPGHRRRSLIRKPQDKKRQAPPSPQDVMLEVDPGAAASVSRWPLTFLLILLFFLLVAATLLLPMAGGLCCSHARLARTPYLVLSYVSGPPPT
ncbi:nesprin-4 isoform X2 [Trichechus manatus latirostris]|uniref:Nesprin-4 isoform X2 n=1 Tax=Trichechus manatus latirostris TaxID=127582 RepID=A0A2Y9RSR6_TRIMA|nr:nesprin-4 isoform X2 [Trichechus manatus latirostris]